VQQLFCCTENLFFLHHFFRRKGCFRLLTSFDGAVRFIRDLGNWGGLRDGDETIIGPAEMTKDPDSDVADGKKDLHVYRRWTRVS
jgi:hypothetical protein